MAEIEAVIFDFGGVLADEGFREGLKAIARISGIDPDGFFDTARRIAYESGYTAGRATESEFWRRIREAAPVELTDSELRAEILSRFRLRPEVFEYAGSLRRGGVKTAILTDQTNWIEEINAREPFYGGFDYVFNSFRINKTKLDPTVFTDVCRVMGTEPARALFVDDSPGHVERAASRGLKTILYEDFAGFRARARELVGDVPAAGGGGERENRR
jgi:putative hydrolase of the HAD superfamily